MPSFTQMMLADDRNFYKLEKWTKDGMKVECMLYAGMATDERANRFTSRLQQMAIRAPCRQTQTFFR